MESHGQGVRVSEHNEASPLLPTASPPSHRHPCSQKVRFFATLTLVLLFFKGGEEMASATKKQYVYYWCEQYVNTTTRTLVPANISLTTRTLVPVNATSTTRTLVPANISLTTRTLVLASTSLTTRTLVPASTSSTARTLVQAITSSTTRTLVRANTLSTTRTLVPASTSNTSSITRTHVQATTRTTAPVNQPSIILTEVQIHQHLIKSSYVVKDSNSSTQSCGRGSNSGSVEHAAQVLASSWELYFSILDAVLLFFSMSLYGTLSDYLGRKPFVCLCLTGYALKTTFFVVIIRYKLHIGFMFVSYTVDGLCGSSFAFSLFSYTMTADVTRGARERVMGVAIMETLISLGRCTTQFGNGYFIRAYGFLYPMLTAAIAAFLSLFFAVMLLRETHPRIRLQTLNGQPINRLSSVPSCSTLVKNYTSFYVGPGGNRTLFMVCFSVFFLLEFGILGRFDVLTLYQLGSPFCWDSGTIGLYTGAQMATCYVVGSLLLKPLQLCRVPDHVSACLGLVSAIAFNLVTAFATTTVTLFVGIAAGLLMILPKSILRGLASSRATEDKQGAMFAGLSSSELVCKLMASPASLAIYAHTLTTMKGAVFLVLASVNFAGLVVMVTAAKLFRRGNDASNPVLTENAQ